MTTHRPPRSHRSFGGWIAAAAMLPLLAACGGDSDDGAAEIDFDSLSIQPGTACTMTGIGATALTADAAVSILEVSSGSTGGGSGDRAYCLVKTRVGDNVNIWVALPSADWNGRLRAEGNGVFGGASQLVVPADSVRQGFVGVKTDTGHAGTAIGPFPDFLDGSWGMNASGGANVALQTDFAHRSEYLMSVVGKQVARAFYGRDPVRSYWYGCSTGGRQGLMMAQRYPEAYDAILAGAPAIHWDRFQAYQIWPQVAMKYEAGGPMSTAKQALVTARAVAACDADDGVTDGVIDDPRSCSYDPTNDVQITRADCADDTCLTPGQASGVKKIWGGATSASGRLLWPGIERGADLGAFSGMFPFPIPTEQARYWVYFDPTWDWNVLTYQNYETYFDDNARMVGPMMATDNPDLSAFKARGGKIILWHGWSDQLIMPQGTVRYYERVRQTVPGSDEFSRLYMVPGMAHCAGGTGVSEFGQVTSGLVAAEPRTDMFRALMAWSEKGQAPTSITAARIDSGAVTRTRPLCPFPQVARHTGSGSTDDAANFRCVTR